MEIQSELRELLIGSPGGLITALSEVDQRVGAEAGFVREMLDGDARMVEEPAQKSGSVEAIDVGLVSQKGRDARELLGLGFHCPELPIPQGILGNTDVGCGPFLCPT